MIKKLIYIICIVLIFLGLLWLGGTTWQKYKNDIKLQSPLDVFNINVPSLEEPDINLPEIPEVHAEIPEVETPDIDIPDITTPNIPEIEEPDINLPEIENPNIELPSITREEVDGLVSKIRRAETKKEDYERDKFEKPTKYFYIDGTRYTRNKYAWHISKYLVSEDPFEYLCPYTGLTIIDIDMLDFEHIVSLKTTYMNCPDWWTEKEMNEYAYDQLVGVDVYNKANRSKGAKTPSEWLPEVNIEDFCFTYLAICYKYDIAMDKRDIDVCKLEIYNALSTGEEVTFINQFNEDTEEYERQQEWLEEIKNL